MKELLIGKWKNAQILRYDSITSTNDEAKKLIKTAESPLILIAKSQTKGRGRKDRSFFSPKGGLYFSIAWKEPIPYNNSTILTPIAGLAMAKSLKELYGLDIKIKWVNDLEFRGAKACGILAESQILPIEKNLEKNLNPHNINKCYKIMPYSYVIGIGLNLLEPPNGFPEEIKSRAIALFDKLPKEFSEDILISNFISRFSFYISGDPDKAIKEYEKFCSTIGKQVSFESNGKIIHGRALGVHFDGSLKILTEKGQIEKIGWGELES